MKKSIYENRTTRNCLIVASLLLFAQAAQIGRADTGRKSVNTLNGMRVYNRVCKECHDEGKNGAPRLEETREWQRRIFQGEEVLDQHALQGYVRMPAKGGHPELSDQDVIDAVHYIIVMLRDEPTR